MKFLFMALILIISMIGLTGCGESKKVAEKKHLTTSTENQELKIKFADQTFELIIENNPTTAKFIKNLPLEIDMQELNGNEKYFYFNESFPTNSINPKTIQAGDLKLYGDNCLVLFYENFSTRYSYTRLGRIKNPENLADVVGSGKVHIIISN